MINGKTLEQYQFKTISDYFEYIKTTMLNGQRQQTAKLFLALSKNQRKEFLLNLLTDTDHLKGVDLSTLRYCISLIY